MTRQQRYKKIVKRYNRWIEKYIQVADDGDWEAAAYYAFMLNAITEEVLKSPNAALRKYFYKHSKAGNHARLWVSGT